MINRHCGEACKAGAAIQTLECFACARNDGIMG